MPIASAPTLSDELAAIEAEFPGWNLHLSEEGSVWMESVSGITLRATTPELARQGIALWEHQSELRWAAAAQLAAAVTA